MESANVAAAPGAQRRLRRDVGRVGLLFTSVGSIIGSGWLLGALAASAVAGPAAVLMLMFSAINVMGVRWLSETNKVAVWWKIAVPVLAVVVLMITAFHPHNFSAAGGFMPFGWKGVFLAVASGV